MIEETRMCYWAPCHRRAAWRVDVVREWRGVVGSATMEVCGVHLHKFLDSELHARSGTVVYFMVRPLRRGKEVVDDEAATA